MRLLLAALFCAHAASATAQQQDPDMPEFDPAPVSDCLAQNADNGIERQNCIGLAATPCMTTQNGATTVGMSYCLGRELGYWDDLLNRSYGELVEAARAEDAEMADLGSAAPPQLPALRQMQRSWIAYRDAACAYERSRWGGGTGGGPASAQCALTLTARQYLWLQDYSGARP